VLASDPKVQQLIDSFTADIKDLTRKSVLDALAGFTRSDASQTRKPVRIQRTKAITKPEPPAVAESVSPVRSRVSKEIMSKVEAGVVSAEAPFTSRELATRLGLKETSVRYALGDLVDAKTVTKRRDGLRVLYATA
jgi:DNA-binding transcriptional ArsR family regulator